MRVLLTNDDGVRSAGISAIRAALTGVCTSVVTVAPAADCSGFARKGTFDRPVVVWRREGGPHPVYECDGTPTDCVRAGLLGGLAAGTVLVVSGINHGANVADDVVYSGTVGAALEAAVLGTPALCLSQQSLSPRSLAPESAAPEYFDFSLAARYGAGLAAAIAQARPQELFVLSVNYPPAGPGSASTASASTASASTASVSTGSARPAPAAVLTRPGQRVYPRAPVKDWDTDPGPQSIYPFGEPDEVIPEAGGQPDTDLAALRRGLISVTPLSVAIGLDEVSPAMTSFLAQLPVSARWPEHPL